MKKLTTLLLIATIVFGSPILTTVDDSKIPTPRKITIPKKFENYRQKAKTTYNIIGIDKDNDKLFLLTTYDLYGSPAPEVIEMTFPPDVNPMFYGFDFNDDEKITPKESVFDKECNGLNGDETRYLDELKRSLEEANSPKKISI